MPSDNTDDAVEVEHRRSARSRIRRRRYLKGFAGAAAMGSIAGCGGGGDGGDGGDGGGDGGSTSGGDGGDGGDGSSGGDGDGGSQPTELVFASTKTPDSMDPHASSSSVTYNMFIYTETGYENLLAYNPENPAQLLPQLATRVPTEDDISDDLTTVDFHLREGVMFHTGNEMTADDVKYSWDRCITMNLNSSASTLANYVDEVEVLDDYTVRIHLTGPQVAPFLTSAVQDETAVVMDGTAIEENGGYAEGETNEFVENNSVGTGPYVQGDLQPGTEFVMEPFEDYWGHDVDDGDWVGVAKPDRIRQLAAPNVATRISMLQQGDAHTIVGSSVNLDQFEGKENVKVSFANGGPNPDIVHLNFEIPYGRDDIEQITGGDDTVPSDFFQDPNVRKAFNYAFDYETYGQEVLNGAFVKMNSVHMPNKLGFDPDAPQFSYDPEKVEELLKEAGYWEEGFRITIIGDANTPKYRDMALLFKDSFEAINDRITINASNVPESQHFAAATATPMGAPMVCWGLSPAGQDPHPDYNSSWEEDGGLPAKYTMAYKYEPQEIKDRIRQGLRQPTTEQRIPHYQELQRLCFENPPNIAVGVQTRIDVSQPCVDALYAAPWLRPHLRYYGVEGC